MKTIGINIGHDGGCALLENGDIKVAISEERLIRQKYAKGWLNSLFYCLKVSNYNLLDIDRVIFSSYRETLPDDYDGGLSKLGYPKERCISVDHHLSHAYSSFYPSPFDEASIFIYDCHGNNSNTEGFYLAKGNNIKKIGSNPIADPLKGIVRAYEAFTCYFGWNSDQAGKTMGLASYGNEDKFKEYSIYNQTEDGWYFNKLKKYYAEGAEELINRYGLDIPPKYSENPLVYKDAAAWIQSEFEKAIFGTINKIQELTKINNFCLAGGGALNSVCNGKILKKTQAENLFIFPAASDKGECVGNALYGYYNKDTRPKNTTSLWVNDFTGKKYKSEKIRELIEPDNRAFRENTIPKAPSYKFTKPENITKKTAELIADKKVIGWFQGGSELGPRALGHRSIICDPRSENMKDKVNKKVKHRENFRPFAPSILLEKVQEYFDIQESSPFMLRVFKVKPDKKSTIPAVTHVDSSARPQTVSKEHNEKYHKLIEDFYDISGVPVVLNTSFNLSGEPIVETPGDAMRCFLKTEIDYLVLGPYLVWKE